MKWRISYSPISSPQLEKLLQEMSFHRDLADLYGVGTRVLNQAIRRNINRFPKDFMFELSREELRNISQFVICSEIRHARSVHVFTEQGIAMLSSVLRSKRDIQVNIAIMRVFIRLREIRKEQGEYRGNARFKSHFRQ